MVKTHHLGICHSLTHSINNYYRIGLTGQQLVDLLEKESCRSEWKFATQNQEKEKSSRFHFSSAAGNSFLTLDGTKMWEPSLFMLDKVETHIR